MSVIFERSFRVRHYECDSYQHLNNVNYIRYMQETALDASAAVGWDTDRYQQIGQQWLIRETDITFYQPLLWNERVTVRTYVLDFRRVQSRRRYEFIRERDGEQVAVADTNWVLLDSETGHPVRVPQAMIQSFAPDGLPDAPPIERFPEAPPVPEGAYTLRQRVSWRDIDTVGHANNAAYMAYCEDASTQAGRPFGWTMQRMMDRGFAMILRGFRIVYRQAARLDDEITITTWVSDVRRARATRHYVIRRKGDDAILAQAYGLLVCFDLKKQRPMRPPDDFLADFASQISG